MATCLILRYTCNDTAWALEATRREENDDERIRLRPPPYHLVWSNVLRVSLLIDRYIDRPALPIAIGAALALLLLAACVACVRGVLGALCERRQIRREQRSGAWRGKPPAGHHAMSLRGKKPGKLD